MGCSSSKDAVADQAKRESQPVAEQAPAGVETLAQEAGVVQKSPMSALETGTAMYMRLYPENSNDGSE
jgi:polyhydroxyalkanoate synthesis regulator phasin